MPSEQNNPITRILYAVYRHRKEFLGRLPKRIELDGKLYVELINRTEGVMYVELCPDGQTSEFLGTPLSCVCGLKDSRLIDINNEPRTI